MAVGYNGNNQLDVSAWKDIKAIAAGAYHTVGLKTDGTVVAAGDGTLGQLKVSSWKNIKAIAAGGYHTVGLKEDGTAVAAGYNNYGQLNLAPSFTDIMAACEAPQDAALAGHHHNGDGDAGRQWMVCFGGPDHLDGNGRREWIRRERDPVQH